MPRDHNGRFEPRLEKKHQITLSDETEHNNIRLFAPGPGMSDQNIGRRLRIYMLSVSPLPPSATARKGDNAVEFLT